MRERYELGQLSVEKIDLCTTDITLPLATSHTSQRGIEKTLGDTSLVVVEPFKEFRMDIIG